MEAGTSDLLSLASDYSGAAAAASHVIDADADNAGAETGEQSVPPEPPISDDADIANID